MHARLRSIGAGVGLELYSCSRMRAEANEEGEKGGGMGQGLLGKRLPAQASKKQLNAKVGPEQTAGGSPDFIGRPVKS